MLSVSFQHIRGISKQRERELWRRGILSWDQFEEKTKGQLPLAGILQNSREEILCSSRAALERSDADYFAVRLQRREHYRIALTFLTKTVFLDIETTGLSRYYDDITLVGWSLLSDYGLYIKGNDPKPLFRALSQANVIVTFNGSLFDLPFLRKEFPDLLLPTAHVDLRFLARRVELTGGQKAIERELGILRGNELSRLDGREAPVLWLKYLRGDNEALRLLINYNHADIEGMKAIFDTVVHRLFRKEQIPKNFWHIKQFSTFKSTPPAVVKHQAQTSPKVQIKDLISEPAIENLRIVGIDLTGSQNRPSGWCLLTGRHAKTLCLSSDKEIIEQTLKCKPVLISIDSPLSLPKGRTRVTDDDPGRKQFGIMRSCEKILKRRGINVYPSLIPSMQALTGRGIYLASTFRRLGIPVIESYPGAAQDIMGIPRKRASLEFLRIGLSEFGVEGEWIKGAKTHDELDAITSALVGLFFWSGRFERLGDNEESYLVVPDLKVNPDEWYSRTVIGISGPIAAGKTTFAEFLRDRGYSYGRFSLILGEILSRQGLKTTRELLQQIGNEVYSKPGQQWLCSQLVGRLPQKGNIVIDGLRHPEDHAHLMEEYGPAYFHIYIDAPYNLRLKRYLKLGHNRAEFREATKHPVEANVKKISRLAHENVNNSSSIDKLLARIRHIGRCK